MAKAQEWLDKNYPKEIRSKIRRLDISSYKMQMDEKSEKEEEEGSLKLEGFDNLEELYCFDTKITYLDLSDCTKLTKLRCYSNHQLAELNIKNCSNLSWLRVRDCQLTDIDLSSLDPLKLKDLNLNVNNLTGRDLSMFSKFVNLEELYIANNNFFGTLGFLKNLKNLKALNISNNINLTADLENLPENLEKIWCREKNGKIYEELEKYHRKIEDLDEIETFRINYYYDYQAWKERKKWEKKGFSNEEFEQWAKAGLKLDEWDFANHLRKKGHKPSESDIEELREGYYKAQSWLDREYPENGYHKELESNKEKRRKEIIKLDISNKKKFLRGSLELKGFDNLKYLKCSHNQLTNLILNDCKNLENLDCSDNKFNDLVFLENASSLKHLNISNSPSLEGDLKPLEKLDKLETLNIANTNINEGLEFLPENCRKFYCNNDYQYKSAKLAEELDKSKCSEREGNDKYYNLDVWRQNEQNNLAVSIISPERLFIIRSNIKQFINKWGEKDEKNVIEASKLQSPKELNNYYKWRIYTAQFIGRSSAIAGAILTFQNQGSIGGGILGIYPFAELIVSKLEENLKNKETKWREFLTDTDAFLDNYNGLLGILAQFEIDELKGGTVNKAIKDLNKKVEIFLNKYDGDGNEEIDTNELTIKRDEFVKDLSEGSESKLWGIVESIKKLEKAAIEYRRLSYYGVNKETIKVNVQQSEERKIQVVAHNFSEIHCQQESLPK